MLHVLVARLTPCLVETDMFKKSGLRGKIPTDNSTVTSLSYEIRSDTDRDIVALPAHFAVWLASDEARYLRGKMVWASWDVDELREKTKGLEPGPWLTSNVVGWPFDAEKPLM